MPSEPTRAATNSSPEPTDAELFWASKAGQTHALGLLYDRHAGLVYGIAFRVLGTTPEAEDLTQDIFINLTRSSFDPRRGALRTYLATLTRSRAIDRVRSRTTAAKNLKRWQPGISPTEPSRSPLDHAVQAEQSHQVKTALAQLSQEQQQILTLAYYDGLSQSEISGQLNLPLGTVKARARRGLLKLRQILTDSTH